CSKTCAPAHRTCLCVAEGARGRAQRRRCGAVDVCACLVHGPAGSPLPNAAAWTWQRVADWAAGAARIEGRPPLGGRPSARKPRRPGSAHAHGDSPEAPGPAQKRARAADGAPHGARGRETRGSRSGNGTSGPRSRGEALAGRGRQRALADSVRTAERQVCSQRERGLLPAQKRYHSEIRSL
ncbi:unnamed protein product, partial [Ixodes pacificus]